MSQRQFAYRPYRQAYKDYKTGKIRGILCNNCNNGLGSFGDNIEGMNKAIDYLQNPPFKNSLAR